LLDYPDKIRKKSSTAAEDYVSRLARYLVYYLVPGSAGLSEVRNGRGPVTDFLSLLHGQNLSVRRQTSGAEIVRFEWKVRTKPPVDLDELRVAPRAYSEGSLNASRPATDLKGQLENRLGKSNHNESPADAASPAASSTNGVHLGGSPKASKEASSPPGQSQRINQQSTAVWSEVESSTYELGASVPAADALSLFLLTCLSIGKYATGLFQLDLNQPAPIVSDRQFLEMLRAKYCEIRTAWRRRLLSLQTLTSIEFVQFELHRKSLVDIRKRNDIPPDDRKDEYHYSPLPAEVIPPVSKNFLMHALHHPEDVDQEPVCLTRFPKRVKQRLQLGEPCMQVG
jgi:hypothetical protein